MSPEAQRIAIAKACGIHVCPHCYHQIDPDVCHCGSSMDSHGWGDGHNAVPMGCMCGYQDAKDRKSKEPRCPDYLGSLDAMHEAFLSLKTTDKIRFHIHLEDIAKGKPDPKLGSDYDYKVSNATASQRAEAFIRTLNLRIDDAR